MEVGKEIRRRFRSYFHYTEKQSTTSPHAIFFTYFQGITHPLAFLYDVSGMFLTWMAMQFAGIPFELLHFKRFLPVWGRWYYFPLVFSIFLLFLFHVIFSQKRRKSQTNEKQECVEINRKEMKVE